MTGLETFSLLPGALTLGADPQLVLAPLFTWVIWVWTSARAELSFPVLVTVAPSRMAWISSWENMLFTLVISEEPHCEVVTLN